jgi:outer membrane protein
VAVAYDPRAHLRRPHALALAAPLLSALASLCTLGSPPPALSAPLKLSDLLSCARRTNPAHDIARAQALEAAAQLTGARLSVLPTLSFSGGAAPLPARRMLQYCVGDQERVIVCPNQDINDDQRLDQLDGMGLFARAQVTLTQPLYTFGKITHGRDAAEAGVRAYEAGAAYAERALDVMAFEAYHGLQLSAQVEAVFRRGREELGKFKRRVQRSLDEERGEYSSNDLRRLVIQESDLIARELEAQALKAQAVAGVRVACELTPDAEVTLAEQRLSAYAAPLPPLEALWSIARRERLDLRGLREGVEAREALARKALADQLPNLALIGLFTYSVGTSADDHPDPFANDPFNIFGYGFMFGLDWRLSVSELFSETAQADAQALKARAELRGRERAVYLELSERHAQAMRHASTLTARDEAARAGKQWMVASLMSKSAGLLTSEQATQSLTGYFTSSLAREQSIFEYNLSIARLWASAGLDLAALAAGDLSPLGALAPGAASTPAPPPSLKGDETP